MKKKDQISFDQQEAMRLQAEFDEEERLAREKKEANTQEELTDAEKATLFVQLLEKRKKHFAAKRVEEKRNRPPKKAQQRSIMCTYLKDMDGWKPKDLKNKSFANIQALFEKAIKRVNTFVDFRTKLVEGTEKKKGSKKAKAEVIEATKMKELMDIVPDEEEVAIDAIPLDTKPPSIVDWKIIKEGKINNFQIIRADGSLKSEGFEQIVDFLNASSIRYALTVNPTIYTSCIQQFWATVKVKTINEEVQLQALVDGKKIMS
ncbi:hypothetical protein Tco_0525991 [Tanacetum coccineum]